MAGWRYYAHRLNGDGTETRLASNVPLRGTGITRDFSGPGGITATISPQHRRLQTAGGEPLFQSWSTAIYAEKDGLIRGAGLVTDLEEDGPELTLDLPGFTYYPVQQPYIGENSIVRADACDVARHVWQHLQGKPGGNLGMTFDTYQSGTLIGTRPAAEGEDAAQYPGPYILADWQTKDLGAVFDDMAKAAPFEYLTDHWWDGEQVRHHVRMGRDLGRRRDDLRFVVGENIRVRPPINHGGEEYADEILILGAGEGSKMVRGLQQRASTGRLRRAQVIEAKDVQDTATANRRAAEELAYRLGDPDLDVLEVVDHPNAPLGSYDAGDQIRVRTRAGWSGELDLWVRILSLTIRPETNTTTLTVARAEKIV